MRVEEDARLTDRQLLVIEEEFVSHDSPFLYIATTKRLSTDPVSSEEKARRVRQLMSRIVLVLLQESDHQLFSFESLFFTRSDKEDGLCVHPNRTSFVGMGLLLGDEPISKEKFAEIYELLDSEALGRPKEARMSRQFKFRALGMALLHLIFEKRVSLMDGEKWDQLGSKTCLERCKKLLRGSKQRFSEFLNSSKVRAEAERVEEEMKARLA
jgi:hypothetical protein